MRVDQLVPCPFCGKRPIRHDSVGPSGYAWSTEDDQIFPVSCMAKDCPPSGVYMPDVIWNRGATSQEALMDEVFATLKDELSPELNDKQDFYRKYLAR